MPNDMSPIPTPDLTAYLMQRTQRYCDRANTLTGDPSLTQATAVRALNHLATLHGDIRNTRLRQSTSIRAECRRLEAPFKTLEASLKDARATLSEALLRAAPDPTSNYGPVSHSTSCDAANTPLTEPQQTSAPSSSGAPQAVSASRALLDLETLRPYLSDAALRDALERYSKDTGNHDVSGVAYAALPASAHLPCAIY